MKADFLRLFFGVVSLTENESMKHRIKVSDAYWQMLKAPPVNPRDYISGTSKISPREGH